MILVENFKKNQIVDLEIDYFLDRIKNKDFFSYSRFNDGELICAIKNFTEVGSTHNCDKHEYFPDLGLDLIQSLNNADNKNYFIQYLSAFINNSKYIEYTETLLKNNKLNGQYVSSDFLQIMLRYKPEEFKKFIDILNQNQIMIVGPEYLNKFKLLNITDFIQVPTKNCYLHKDRILHEIRNKLKENQIVLFSSSMATNSFINVLFAEYGNTNFFIDAGSIWDIFFYKTNPEIKQRSVNFDKITQFSNWYKDFFIDN
jgi:hypothetical protein